MAVIKKPERRNRRLLYGKQSLKCGSGVLCSIHGQYFTFLITVEIENYSNQCWLNYDWLLQYNSLIEFRTLFKPEAIQLKSIKLYIINWSRKVEKLNEIRTDVMLLSILETNLLP